VLKTQERTIDGMRFTVGQLPAMRAMKLLNRITRIAAPAVARAAAALKSGQDLASMDLGSLGGAVESLFLKLPDDELEGITRELFSTVLYHNEANGQAAPLMEVFDAVMMGRMPTVLKLLGFAFEVNYGNFFDALRGLNVGGVMAKVSTSKG
jgi:hypothetical protein